MAPPSCCGGMGGATPLVGPAVDEVSAVAELAVLDLVGAVSPEVAELTAVLGAPERTSEGGDLLGLNRSVIAAGLGEGGGEGSAVGVHVENEAARGLLGLAELEKLLGGLAVSGLGGLGGLTLGSLGGLELRLGLGAGRGVGE